MTQPSAANFTELVQKYFSSLRSETKAMSAAIDEDGPGYKAWMATGKSMHYVPTVQSYLSPAGRREVLELPPLEKLPPDSVIAVSLKEIALLSSIPCGSAKFFLQEDKIRPAIPGSNCYLVKELLTFAQKHRCRTATRLVQAVGRGGDVDAAARALVAAATLQNPKLFSSTATSKSK